MVKATARRKKTTSRIDMWRWLARKRRGPVGKWDADNIDVVQGTPGERLAVAVVKVSFKGNFATAFLVAPDLLLTNHHVMFNTWTKKERSLNVYFERPAEKQGQETTIESTTSKAVEESDKTLDYAIVRLSRAIDRPTVIPLPVDLRIEEKDPAIIVQYPKGMLKQVAVRNNRVITIGDNKIWYTGDTDTSSSGSPVFNSDWHLVALHTGNGEIENDRLVSNQGTRIDRILEDLAKKKSSIVGELSVVR